MKRQLENEYFSKITAVKKAFYDVMLNQDVKAEKLFVGSVAILRVLSVHSAIQQQAPQHCCTEPSLFLKTAQKECKRKIKPLPILSPSITLKHHHSIARHLFSI